MLRDLVEALDRRVPHAERVGETRIALDAAALRKAALKRIEELTQAS
jgi:t-SNARE complex subunit (syntaxin)